MTRIALAIATWFGCGYIPKGPGTAGSLAAILIAAALVANTGNVRSILLVLIVVLFLPSVWAATCTARYVREKDPGMVVVDEVLGQWTTLLGATVLNGKALAAGFILFRIFDIWKPTPVRQLESLPEGWGIIADDIAAGLYGALILYIGGLFRLY